jgi:TonB family protein
MKTMKSILTLTLIILSFGCTNRSINKNVNNSEYTKPMFVKGGAKTGYRSRKSIMRGIMENILKFRKLYREEYNNQPPLKIVAYFKISNLGNVTSSEIKESNSNNSAFDSKILEIINSIQFENIGAKIDSTEVTYPFVFSKE